MRDRYGWTGGTGGAQSHARARYAEAEPRTVRLRYSMEDIATLLWRERLTMVLAFAVVFLAGLAFALTLPKTYAAHSSLLINLGPEYVYRPKVGDAGAGVAPQKDEVVQSEAEIIGSDELKRRTIQAVGLKVVDPKLAEAWNGADAAKRAEIEGAALKVLQRGLTVSTAPESNVVRVDFKHSDPQAAALILNTLVTTYLQYRREVFTDVATPALQREKAAFEERLKSADAAYEDFLQRNGVADFTGEKAALAATYQSIFDEKYKAEAQLRETQGQLAALKARIGEAPGEIEIQRDIDLSVPQQLLKLKADRQNLLARYLPDAQPVKDIDAQIARLNAMVGSGQGVGEKDRRLGANPVRQSLETSRITLEAQAGALTERRNELNRQLGQVQARQMRLTGLESQYQSLAVERDVLQSNVKNFATRAAENRAAHEMGKSGDDNIRVIERAQPPVDGKSLKKIVFGLALLFALFTAICAGLMRVFSRRGFATASAAERTLELPVLATAPLKT